MENNYGQHGWKEFNRNRKDILSELDKLIEQIENRPIKVAHGPAVEAYIRKWLSEFLPKKYGVTSGYIIPNLYNNEIKLYHYDIIIFNQLEAPILWTEGNSDQSEQGKFRAIPAKHVVAIYKVKSRFTKSNITQAFSKLNQTKDFKEQLNMHFSCGIIFIDLKESENNNESLVKELIKSREIIGYSGSLILRYERDHSCIGRILLLNSNPNTKIEKNFLVPIAKSIDELEIYKTEDGKIVLSGQGSGFKILKISEKNWGVSKTYSVNYTENSKSVLINWSRSNFADFCIDLLSSLEGLTINDKNRPSFGQIFDNIELKKSPLQSINFEKNKPFLQLKLINTKNNTSKSVIDFDKPNPIVEFIISIENIGNVDTVLSDDFFNTQVELQAGQSAKKTHTFEVEILKGKKRLNIDFNKNPFDIPYRVVYYPINTNKDFISIEKIIRIMNNKIVLLDKI
jgi:hypothetical protein